MKVSRKVVPIAATIPIRRTVACLVAKMLGARKYVTATVRQHNAESAKSQRMVRATRTRSGGCSIHPQLGNTRERTSGRAYEPRSSSGITKPAAAKARARIMSSNDLALGFGGGAATATTASSGSSRLPTYLVLKAAPAEIGRAPCR